MESGNSSSMQSSSGGGGGGGGGGDDQEFDSNIGGTSNFFFSSTNPSQYHSSLQQLMFSSNPPGAPALSQLNPIYVDAFGDQSSYQNLMFWQQQQQQHHQQQQSHQQENPLSAPPSATPDHPLQPSGSFRGVGASTQQQQRVTVQDGGVKLSGAGADSSAAGGQKNPRKRTRASRRAPTTVLTTDTTNFRAMVQEFTGIPSSPFSSASSPLLSRRLTDLFAGSSGSSGTGTGLRPGVQAASNLGRLLAGYGATNYPYRPAPQKPTTGSLLVSISTGPHSLSNESCRLSGSTQHFPFSNAPSQLSLPLTHGNNHLPFHSLLQSGTPPSSSDNPLRFLPGGSGLLSGSGTHFQDLSGIIGNDDHQHIFMTSNVVDNRRTMGVSTYPPPMVGGWHDGLSIPSSDGGCDNTDRPMTTHHVHTTTRTTTTATTTTVIRDDNNQRMAGTISGSGTSCTNHHHQVNDNVGNVNLSVNMNCSTDNRSLDTDRGGTSGTNFLD